MIKHYQIFCSMNYYKKREKNIWFHPKIPNLNISIHHVYCCFLCRWYFVKQLEKANTLIIQCNVTAFAQYSQHCEINFLTFTSYAISIKIMIGTEKKNSKIHTHNCVRESRVSYSKDFLVMLESKSLMAKSSMNFRA